LADSFVDPQPVAPIPTWTHQFLLHVLQQHPLDLDFVGHLCFSKKAAAVLHQKANRHALIDRVLRHECIRKEQKVLEFCGRWCVCELLGKTTGRGVGLSNYECLDTDTPSRFYVDVDYAARERNDKDFQKRFEHCKLVLRGFFKRFSWSLPKPSPSRCPPLTASARMAVTNKRPCMPARLLHEGRVRPRRIEKSPAILPRESPQKAASKLLVSFLSKVEGRSHRRQVPHRLSRIQLLLNWRTLYSE
jgi:hypothetical protein